jgi:hypothetical protein
VTVRQPRGTAPGRVQQIVEARRVGKVAFGMTAARLGALHSLSTSRGETSVLLGMVSAGVGGGVLGFLAGYTTFKRSLIWCRDCGRTLKCLNCLRVAPTPAPRPDAAVQP